MMATYPSPGSRGAVAGVAVEAVGRLECVGLASVMIFSSAHGRCAKV
jgi:hypothetical protein